MPQNINKIDGASGGRFLLPSKTIPQVLKHISFPTTFFGTDKSVPFQNNPSPLFSNAIALGNRYRLATGICSLPLHLHGQFGGEDIHRRQSALAQGA